MSKPRKHHFVPRFYLAGFTVEGQQNGVLYGLARPDAKVIRGTPATLGFQNDLYSIDHPELDSSVIDNAYGEIEHQTAPALRGLLDDSQPTDPKDIALFLNLVAVLATRVPALRKRFAAFIAEVGKKFTNLVMQHPERLYAMGLRNSHTPLT